MTESVSEDAASARALEQARLRKERREAKIKAGGASRLNRIAGAGGGIQRDAPSAPAPAPATSESPMATPPPPPSKKTAHAAAADPDEVDISQHFYTPPTTQRVPPPPPGSEGMMSEAQLRQMMLGMDQQGFPGGGLNGSGAGGGDDPMLNMLLQMMGGGGPSGTGGGGMPGPGMGMGGGGPNPFANMANLMGGGGNPQAAAAGGVVLPDRYASLWRLLHTAVALGLGLYIALWTSFSGTKAQREMERADAGNAESAKRFFYAFATAEAVLLTTRYFVDRRGRGVNGGASAGGSGMLGMLVGFLPPPVKGYVEMGMRYAQIFGTVRSDVLVCIFVLGVCSWVRA
ncbi:hypothetical protein QBC47DRAFT_409151 [Echria macrotheca]|uniref:Golgi to ER traffic protein 2 n=1 Tax=Echria macrotheca TaxID=438768 RepID=A0AAJ0BNF0_9PEZI|nr:hypothetical protein QBC47DRAFT_409151 [Echria macrotheca]